MRDRWRAWLDREVTRGQAAFLFLVGIAMFLAGYYEGRTVLWPKLDECRRALDAANDPRLGRFGGGDGGLPGQPGQNGGVYIDRRPRDAREVGR